MPALNRVLVVAAHPDDEVLGCGATIARLAREGNSVHIAIVAEGITSRAPNREAGDFSAVELLQQHGRNAAKVLGAQEISFYGLPDNRLDTMPLLDIVKMVEQLIHNIQPDCVYTHHAGDLNLDHVAVSRAVTIATRPVQGCPVRELYQFEVPSSTDWSFQQFEPSFRPNVFMEIHQTLPLKLEAMSCYKTEVRAFPHPRSGEALSAIARRWGSVAGLPAAEVFQLVRAIS
jgi:LmbE family N-acetylglucosaminyl deacetylase